MVSDRDATSKLNQALDKFERKYGKAIAADTRSAVTRIMLTVLTRMTSPTGAKKAFGEIRAAFTDWNEVRVSEARELISILTNADIKEPWTVAREMYSVLTDIFEQYNIVNFEFGKLDETKFRQEIQPDSGEQSDQPTIREEGLPPHPKVPGFLDGERLLTETSLLELKLLKEKNSEQIFNVVWDNPETVPAAIVAVVMIDMGVLDEGMNPLDAITRLRTLAGNNELDVARYSMAWFDDHARDLAGKFEKLAPMPAEPEDKTPFSVQIGFVDKDDHKGKEPVMPRGEGIGREQKRARAKYAPPAGDVATEQRSRTATGKVKAGRKATAKTAKRTAKKATAKK